MVDTSEPEKNRALPKNKAHLELAASFATQAWFPPLPQVLNRFKSNLANDSYRDDPSLCLDELRCDLSLFLFVVSRLKNVSGSNSHLDDPIARLTEAVANGELKRLFTDTSITVSPHNIAKPPTDWNGGQSWLLHGTTIAASAAYTLAPSFALNRDLAYLVSTLRQLGLILIFWNYPRVFERALADAGMEKIEPAIYSILGFTPTQLGARVAEMWGLGDTVQAAIANVGAGESPSKGHTKQDQSDLTAQNLARVCQIGERLAKASNPAVYPEARASWDEVALEIKEILGPTGLEEIYARFTTHAAAYCREIPAQYPILESSQPLWKSYKPQSENSSIQEFNRPNRYVVRCDVAVQRLFSELYQSLQPNLLSLHTLEILSKKIIPTAGFTRGCLYLLEPLSKQLVPRFSLGQLELSSLRPISLAPTNQSEENIFVAAYRARNPIVQEGLLANGDPIVLITGSVGSSESHANGQKIGVLFLESASLRTIFGGYQRSQAGTPNTEPLLMLQDRFKAIREALQDALGSLG